MNALAIVCASVLIVLAGTGLYKLQSWLENWDHNRHLQD